MHLEHIEVVNFRGIGRLLLDLEAETTVLFGENAWGKTSLVEALSSALGARPITEEDFYRLPNARATIAQRLGITLRFAGTETDTELDRLGWRDRAGVLHLSLQWSARRLERGRVRLRRVFLDGDGLELPMEAAEAERLADRIVRSHPLIVFRELRLAEWMATPASASDRDLRESPTRAVQRIFERLLAVPHQVHPEELARGLEALHRLAEQRPDLFKPKADVHPLRRASDMAETPLSLQDGRSLSDLASRAGSGMRQAALLVLVGAMLKAEAVAQSGSDSEIRVQPMLLVEDPETHLHPIQLAAAWNLLEQLPAQKLVTTAHGALLAGVPTRVLRRLVRHPRHVQVHPSPEATPLDPIDARRVAFHVRTHNAGSLFARVWLLVEGETEAWLLPELARVGGLGFPLEGIACVEFAQAGLAPLIAFADRFGIPWHLVADGDEAGRHYIAKARRMLKGRSAARHITALPDLDIEHFLWNAGFEDVFRTAAQGRVPPDAEAHEIIHRALKARTKPGMALELAEAAGQRGAGAVPSLMRHLFGMLRELARQA